MTKIAIPTLESLFKAGAHFGHLRDNSHPKSQAYTYAILSKVQVIDLEKTQQSLKDSLTTLEKIVKGGETILFVATKRQANNIVSEIAQKFDYPYVTSKWLGGTLTNYSTIKRNIQRLKEMRATRKSDEYASWSKKRKVGFNKKLEKFERLFAGIANLNKLPDAVFIIDPAQEEVALKEARQVGAKVFALMDTGSNPADIDYPIFANDDSVKTIKLIMGLVDRIIAKANKFAKSSTKEKKNGSGKN